MEIEDNIQENNEENTLECIEKLRSELGDYNYDEYQYSGKENVEYRPLVENEEHRKYDGEWIVDQEII